MTQSWDRRLEELAKRLIRLYQGGTTDLAPDTYEIDVHQYLDEQRFEREIAILFRRTPLLLALSVELPSSGSFKKLEIADLPVLLARGRDGAVRLFLNVCRHRGAPVVVDTCGTTRRFVCPYHAWSYNLDGSLANVVAAETFGEVDRDARGLVELPCEERDGIIWGMGTPGAIMDLDAHLGDLGPELAELQLATLHHGATRRLESGNWKLAIDSYLENYHVQFLHSTTLYRTTQTNNIAAVDFYGRHQRMAAPRKTISELSEGDLAGKHLMSYFSLNYTIFPNTTLLVSPGTVMVAQVLPGSKANSSVTVLEHFSRDPRTTQEAEKAFDARVDVLSGAIQDEDYWIADLIERGMRSGANSHLIFGRNEPLLHHFHAEIDKAVDATIGQPV